MTSTTIFFCFFSRQNGNWSGCFGRVAYESYFSTVTTDPKPNGKQGRVLHQDPKQKRVFSVREMARAQGMPDSFKLAGEIKDKYKQIGNAVPIPLASAIGFELRKSVSEINWRIILNNNFVSGFESHLNDQTNKDIFKRRV